MHTFTEVQRDESVVSVFQCARIVDERHLADGIVHDNFECGRLADAIVAISSCHVISRVGRLVGCDGDYVWCIWRQSGHRVVWRILHVIEPFPYKSFVCGISILYDELVNGLDQISHTIEDGITLFVELGSCGVETEHIDGDEGRVSETTKFVFCPYDELLLSAFVEIGFG